MDFNSIAQRLFGKTAGLSVEQYNQVMREMVKGGGQQSDGGIGEVFGGGNTPGGGTTAPVVTNPIQPYQPGMTPPPGSPYNGILPPAPVPFIPAGPNPAPIASPPSLIPVNNGSDGVQPPPSPFIRPPNEPVIEHSPGFVPPNQPLTGPGTIGIPQPPTPIIPRPPGTTPPPVPGQPNLGQIRQPNGPAANNTWKNFGTHANQVQEWMPDWWRTETDPAALQEAQRRFRGDLSTGDELAMQEAENMLANRALAWLNPKDAQAVATSINVLGNDQGTYDPQNFGYKDGYKAGATSDVNYQQANKWDDFMAGYGRYKNDLIGNSTEQDFANDGTLDPFESMDRFIQGASQIGKNFALDPVTRNNSTGGWVNPATGQEGKSRLNRWQEVDLNEQWENLAATGGINASSPLYRAIQGMVMPTRSKPTAAKSSFRVGGQQRNNWGQ